jgi:protein-disulfide isomerase
MTTPTPHPAAPRPGVNRRALALLAAGALLVLLVALAILLPDGAEPAAAPSVAPAPTQPADGAGDAGEATAPVEQPSAEELQAQRDAAFAALVRRQVDDPTALGSVDAPVVMIMWADYRCGYCAQWATQTAPGLAERIVDGTLRLEWRDFPVITEQSPALAVAARAAGLQGRFWEFHDRLFADHATVASMDDAYLRGVAADLGLDVERFDADRTSEEVVALVTADMLEGRQIGVSSTPTFLVNGTAIRGAQPIEHFLEVVDAEVARAAS